MEFINEAVLHAAGQWWIYPLLLVFFFVDGFAMVVPSETLIVALAAFSLRSGEPNLWILGLTALIGAIAGDNMAYLLGRRIGLERFRWMRRPKVQLAFSWARQELERRGAVLIFTARYIPWGRVAVNYVAGHHRFSTPALLRPGCDGVRDVGGLLAGHRTAGQFLPVVAPQPVAERRNRRRLRDRARYSD